MTHAPETKLGLYRSYAQAALASGESPEEADAIAKTMIELDLAFARKTERDRIAQAVGAAVSQGIDAMLTAKTATGQMTIGSVAVDWDANLAMVAPDDWQGDGTTTVNLLFPPDFDALQYRDEAEEAIRCNLGDLVLALDWSDYDPYRHVSDQISVVIAAAWPQPATRTPEAV